VTTHLNQARRPAYSHTALRRLIDPQTVAVVGLSRNAASFGARTARNLRFFSGRAYGVNPNADELSGLPCHPSVAAIPEPIDCAILAVPLEGVETVVEACAAVGVGGCVIYASGFAETRRPERIALQARLTAISRASGLRIVGPNTVGLINNVTRAGMTFSATYGDQSPRIGPVGIISQSGGLGQAVAQVSFRGGAYSHYLSSGNSCDVDVADYVSYLADDPDCRVIACVVEGLADGERLLEAAERAMAADKPVVIYKIATGQDGAKAAMSHTGTLAGSSAAYEAVYRRDRRLPGQGGPAQGAWCRSGGRLGRRLRDRPRQGRGVWRADAGAVCRHAAHTRCQRSGLRQPRQSLRRHRPGGHQPRLLRGLRRGDALRSELRRAGGHGDEHLALHSRRRFHVLRPRRQGR
jgi:acyl-CoA synthetase (NDP forming)